MFEFIDRYIENKMRKSLHKKRNKIIAQTLADYIDKHHPKPEIVAELKTLLIIEADRVYPVVDESILKERIKRARYTFWITVITSTLISAVIIALTHGLALPLIIPALTAFIAWAVTLATAPLSYNLRVHGAMESIVRSFEKKLSEGETSVDTKALLTDLKQQLNDIASKIELLTTIEANENLTMPLSTQRPLTETTIPIDNMQCQELTSKNNKSYKETQHIHFWRRNKNKDYTEKVENYITAGFNNY